MPILNIHLVRGQHERADVERLLLRCTSLYAEVLQSPLDRIRVFVTEHEPQYYCIGGRLASESGDRAPFFSFLVLAGRSVESRQRLLAGFTELIVESLGVDRAAVRGYAQTIPPEDWGIGGTPASVLRQAEIEARRQAAEKA